MSSKKINSAIANSVILMEAKYKELGSLDKTIIYFKSFNPPFDWSAKPVKPIIPQNVDSASIRKYADLLEKYEADLKIYEAAYEKLIALENEQNTVFEELVKRVSGLYEKVPEQYRDKVYSLAYQNGHSSGFTEIHNHLLDLVGIFE